MALAIDILQSLVIARPRVEIDRRMRPLLEIVDRSALFTVVCQCLTANCGVSSLIVQSLCISDDFPTIQYVTPTPPPTHNAPLDLEGIIV